MLLWNSLKEKYPPQSEYFTDLECNSFKLVNNSKNYGTIRVHSSPELRNLSNQISHKSLIFEKDCISVFQSRKSFSVLSSLRENQKNMNINDNDNFDNESSVNSQLKFSQQCQEIWKTAQLQSVWKPMVNILYCYNVKFFWIYLDFYFLLQFLTIT